MVRKQGAKNTKVRKVSRVRKKNTIRRKQSMALFKTSQSKVKQISNYKSFIKYLLSSDFECDLADDES